MPKITCGMYTIPSQKHGVLGATLTFLTLPLVIHLHLMTRSGVPSRYCLSRKILPSMKTPYLQSLICSTSTSPWFDVQFITKGSYDLGFRVARNATP